MRRAPLVSTILLLLCFPLYGQTAPDDGEVKDGVYYSSFFNLGFRYPADWVVHDEAINDRIREGMKDLASKPRASSQLKNTYLLFTVSRYPRGTPGIAVNPTVLVIAEKMGRGPGNSNGKDYLLSIRQGRLKDGIRPLLNEPVEFRVAGLQFFRDDYNREVNGVPWRQAIFAHVRRGYALAFSFIGEDQKSVEEMAKSMNNMVIVGTGGGTVPLKRIPN